MATGGGARTAARAAFAAAVVWSALPATALAHGDADEPSELREHWMTAWSASPLEVVPIALIGVLYAMRARRHRPAAWRIACFYAGLGLVAVALMSPVDAVGEDGLFAVHMLQHTLLGAIAPLLLLLGVTGPILRPLLTTHRAQRLAILAHPLVAFPLWCANLLFWHIPVVYDAALDSDPLHALEHLCLLTAGLLLWAPIVEPLPGPAWFGTRLKVAYMAGVWFVGLISANIFWFSGSVLYPRYAETAPAFGVSALQDQGDAGTVMMVTHCLLAFGAIAVLFFRQGAEEQLRQRLVEAGIEPARVDRAGRAGHLEHLARRHGIPTRTRGGID